MLTVTPPLAVDDSHVWVLVSGESGAVDAARLAHIPDSATFAALPVHVFNTAGLFPTYADTGEAVLGFRWATTTDIAAHVHLFTD
ncbi:hypothetical protein [Prauserella cavernicola]|uniref:Uncharacterized protein n=1 Tax=Prauserella cavernicola TaxID=2800127 RepID=A0A934QVA5_9PSEU|nr:hypothetical protein [Prauserella cavernicola]MBK1785978.1 hypothetical protein [Prauserella cavernicola]